MQSAKNLTGMLLLLFLAGVSAMSNLDWHCTSKYCFGSDSRPRYVNTISEADDLCKQWDRDSWLLEIYNDEVQKDVMSYFKNSPKLHNKKVILNLIRRGGQWRWLDHTPFDETLAHSNYKMHVVNSDPFATLRYIPLKGIYGLTYVTTLLKDHICLFKGPCNTADSDYIKTLNFEGNCYVSYETKDKEGINWFRAQNHCFMKGGNLAIFPNFTPQKLEKVFKRFTKPMENYWVGLVKHTWEWRHNSASVSNYTNWYQGYPYPTLIHLPADNVFTFFDYSNGGIWTDSLQHLRTPIVCMKNSNGRAIRETSTTEAVAGTMRDALHAVNNFTTPQESTATTKDNTISESTTTSNFIQTPIVRKGRYSNI